MTVPTFICFYDGEYYIFKCAICKEETKHRELSGVKKSYCACWPEGYYLKNPVKKERRIVKKYKCPQ